MDAFFSMTGIESFAVSVASLFIMLGIIVFVHELGHYITARVLGIQVHEFALGMGPLIKQFERVKEVRKANKTYKYRTLWSLRIIPFGGFCRMAGMGAETREDSDGKSGAMDMGEEYDDQPVIPGMGFNEQPTWKRFFILLNGSAANVILALLLVAAFLCGYGVMDMYDTRIGTLLEGFPAQREGFQAGDRILEVNGERVTEWREMSGRLRQAANEGDVTFTVERGDLIFTITTELPFSPTHGYPMLGITPAMRRYSIPEGLIGSVSHIRGMTALMLRGIGNMVTRRTQEIDVMGPVGIASMSGRAMRDGVWSFITLLALISLNIGLLNLFPIPALDGGRIIFVLLEMVLRFLELTFRFMGATFRFLGTIFQFLGVPLRFLEKISRFLEAIFRRRLPEKVENWIHTAGFMLLISLMILVTWRDIYNLFFMG